MQSRIANGNLEFARKKYDKKDENTGGLFKKNKKTKGSINTRL